MIIGFVGTPGSGKSYESVKKLLDNIRLGRKIYTNIDGLDVPECREAIKCYCNITDFQLETCLNHLTREQAQQFWLHCESGSLIMIDETHKLFSNRDWNTPENRQFCDWASTHRHHGYDVVLITQEIDKVDKHARSLIEWTYFFRKANFFGDSFQKTYLCYAYAGDDDSGQPLSKNVRRYDPKIFRCYKSYSAKDVKELGFMPHVNILKHPVFYAIPVVLFVFLYMASQSSIASGDLFGTDKISKSTTSKQKSKTLPSPPPVLPSEPSEFVFLPPAAAPVHSEDTAAYMERGPDRITRYKLPDGRFFYSNMTDMLPDGVVIADRQTSGVSPAEAGVPRMP